MNPAPLKAIIFDLDGTLRHSQPNGSDTFMDFVHAAGLPLGREDRQRGERWQHYYWANSAELSTDLETFKGDEDAFWTNHAYRHIIAMGGSPEQAGRIAPLAQAHMKSNYKATDHVPPELHEVLPVLKQAGLTLGVLSNRDNAFDERVRALGLGEHFDFCLAAGQVGAWKPDPAVFHHVCERAGCRPDEAVYVGDNFFADVVGSRAAGLHPVLYDPRGVFPDPGCELITDFNQLIGLLERKDAWPGNAK